MASFQLRHPSDNFSLYQISIKLVRTPSFRNNGSPGNFDKGAQRAKASQELRVRLDDYQTPERKTKMKRKHGLTSREDRKYWFKTMSSIILILKILVLNTRLITLIHIPDFI